MRILRSTLIIIGVFQLALGLLFTVTPAYANDLFRIAADEPAWVDWLFIMLGARFLGFAYGMFMASRDPVRHVAWINAMIVVQAIDWLGTVGYLVSGAVSITQVSTAAVAPVAFVAVMLWFHPHRVGRRVPPVSVSSGGATT